MTSSLAAGVGVLAVAMALAVVIGVLLRRRSGVLREATAAADTTGLDLSRSGPTVVHFTASWCGPCAAVTRVVDQVCRDLPAVAHVEIDMDANPEAARRLSVLSLPTTLIFDAHGRQRYRAAGVPKLADLRSALTPLLA